MDSMRTTVRLDDDVAAAAEQLRRERGIGLGEAVNELARAGLSQDGRRSKPFRQRTAEVGLKVDVSSIADAFDLVDDLDAEERGAAS